MRTILVSGLLALGRLLPAPTSSACQQILREYQVEHVARLISDSSLDNVPIDTAGSPRNVVEFVVDSSGRVIASSFRALVVASAQELEEAKGLLPAGASRRQRMADDPFAN